MKNIKPLTFEEFTRRVERVTRDIRESGMTVEDCAGSSLKSQVGGDHYKQFKIQPVEFIHQNGLGFIQGCIIKYICRYKSKNGIQDLEKAKHFIDLLIEMEYGTRQE